MENKLPKIYLVIGSKISVELSLGKKKILTKTLEEANLSVRAINGLKINFNCNYVGDIIFLEKFEFRKCQNIGRKTLDEIVNFIENNNFKFGEIIEPWNIDVITSLRNFFEKDIHDSHNSIESDKYLENELHRVITQSINGGKRTSEKSAKGIKSSMQYRAIQLIIDRYGLDGAPSKTLEIIGQKYNVTRERIRQIQFKSMRRILISKIPLPILKKIYILIQEKLPISEEELNLILQKENLTKIEWKFDGLRNFADKLGFSKKNFFYKVINKKAFLINEKSLLDLSEIVSFIKKKISETGLYSIENLQELEIVKKNQFSETFLRNIASINLDFHWLDEEKNWFTFYRERNRLSNLISKAITANKVLESEKLYKSIKKHYRIDKKLLFNINIFIEYCKINYDCILNKDLTIEFHSDVPKLSDFKGYKGNRVAPNENKMINLFKNYGPIISWDDLKELALLNDISIASLTMMLQFSPLFERIDRATYILQGTKLTEKNKNIIKIDFATRSFLKKNCPLEIKKSAYVEIYNYGKYQKTLAYQKPLRKIEQEVYGVDINDKVYSIKK